MNTNNELKPDEKFEKKKKQRKKVSTRSKIATLLFIIGIMIMTYPFASGFIKSINDSKIVNEFREKKRSGEGFEGFRESMKEYNEKIKEGAFNSNSGNLSFDLDEDDEEDEPINRSIVDQDSVVDASGNDKVIGTLIIPRLDEEIPIYYGSNSRILQKGVGILENTSYPGDETGHSIITGHRGTHNAKIFRHLDEMEVDDHFYIETNDEFLKYKVYDYEIVEPDLVQLLGIEEGRDLVTLLTCHPFLINTERILVKSERTEMLPSDYEYLGINDEKEKISPLKEILFKILNDKLFLALILLNIATIVFAVKYIFFPPFVEEEEEREDNEKGF